MLALPAVRWLAALACAFATVLSAVLCAAEPTAPTPAASVPANNPRATGTPFLRVWQPEDYGGSPGNRGILQHPRHGFIYVANGSGVLEFDGARWRLLRVPGGGVQSLALDGRGRLWFASDNQLGYLAPDALGELQVRSALDRLPPGESPLFPVGAAASAPNGVYFINRDRVLFFSDDESRARVWRPNDGELFAGQLWWMEGELSLRAASGVRRLHDGEFRLVDGLKTFAFVTRKDPAGGWQLVSRDGLRRWLGAYVPVAPGLSTLVSPLEGDVALNAVILSDDRIAWGTTRSGVIISDRLGRRVQAIGREHGLPSNRIEGLCEDREGGLWVTLRNGLARLQLDSPYVRHGTDQPVDSTPHALALQGGSLYIGGGETLTRRDAAGNVHPVQDLSYLVRTLVPHENRLFVTGIELRVVSPDDRSRLLDRPALGLVPLHDGSSAFASGTADGLRLSRFQGDTWQSLGRSEKIAGPTAALLEWPAGVVWAANHTTGLWRVDFRQGAPASASAQNFSAEAGLPAGVNQYNIELVRLGDDLLAVALGRLLRFDPSSNRFIPETRIAGLPTVGSAAAPIARIAPSANDRSLWLQVGEPSFALFHVRPAGPGQWRAESAPKLPLRPQRASALLHDPATQTLWIGQPGALLSRDLTWKPSRPPAAFNAVVRRVETDAGALLWADGKSAETLALPAAQNALRILYSAPTYAVDHLGRTRTRYRTRLEGLDPAWSRWTSDARRDFTNLPYRDFVFHVQALDDSGRRSTEATLAFSIAPPWWLTRWAFAGYAVLGLGSLAGLFALRTRTLRQRNEALAKIVATRTEELRRQNHELARLAKLELDEKISARLAEEKARLEVLRYQLNPHFLFNALNSVCSQIIREPVAARTMVVRLADFCRLTLHRPGTEEAAMTIGEELTLLRAYLEIEQARLGELIAVEISSDPAADAFRIPPFLLLPLVENAVKYGAATNVERLVVRLTVHRDPAGVVEIEVANTGTWVAPGSHSAPSHGIGLDNLRQRLARYFPSAHEFTSTARDGWVTMRVRLLAPLHEHPHAHR